MRRLLAVLPVLLALLAAAGCGSSSSPSSSGCKDVSKPKAHKAPKLSAPTSRLDASKKWMLTFATSCGTFVVRLEPGRSPRATASLVSLAQKGYFDNTIVHRIVPGFVIQGGDPTQSGSGGPSYTTVDRPAPGTHYTKGVVAMAKSAAEPPGAAGSQFFVMTADAPTLPPDYAIVGRVVNGLDVVERIGELGDPATEQPTKPVAIEHVTAASA